MSADPDERLMVEARALADAADALRDMARGLSNRGLGHMTWAEATYHLRDMAKAKVREYEARASEALFSGEDHL